MDLAPGRPPGHAVLGIDEIEPFLAGTLRGIVRFAAGTSCQLDPLPEIEVLGPDLFPHTDFRRDGSPVGDPGGEQLAEPVTLDIRLESTFPPNDALKFRTFISEIALRPERPDAGATRESSLPL